MATQSKFKTQYLERFGLKISERNATSGKVVSLLCRFCTTFGREEKVGAKRKATDRSKYFSNFRTDHFLTHLKSQHAQKWAEYEQLQTSAEKRAFFDDEVASANRIKAHFNRAGTECHHINSSIVNVIIGDILFEPEDDYNRSKQRALKIFEEVAEADGGPEDADTREQYLVKIKNLKHFELFVDVLSLGASFRLGSRIMQTVKEHTGVGLYDGCSDGKASEYVRKVCAISLQCLGDVLKSVWGFSIAFDCSTHKCSSYLDIRVRFSGKNNIENYHLIAIPLFDRHTGEYMYEVLKTFFDALIPDWKRRIVGISSDGDRYMTGRVRGLVTRISNEVDPGYIRVWCGLHQLDLAVQELYKESLEEEFLDTLTTMIGYLRRQQNLVQEMKSTCPKVADTRWLSMSTSTNWLKKHMGIVRDYLVEKQRPWAPTDKWWAFLLVINDFATLASKVFRQLQGLSTKLSQQRQALKGLGKTYANMVRVHGPASEEELQMFENSEETEVFGKFYVHHADAREYLENLEVWLALAMVNMPEEDSKDLSIATAKLFVKAVAKLDNITAERNDVNDAGDELPSVLPHQLVKVSTLTFANLVSRYRTRMLHHYQNQDKIDAVQLQYSKLRREYARNADMKGRIDACNDATGFSTAWSAVTGFDDLRDFCGVLASTFPSTATVESDFSVLGWEKNDYRKGLADFSLEGILHAKQYQQLKKCSKTLDIP